LKRKPGGISFTRGEKTPCCARWKEGEALFSLRGGGGVFSSGDWGEKSYDRTSVRRETSPLQKKGAAGSLQTIESAWKTSPGDLRVGREKERKKRD